MRIRQLEMDVARFQELAAGTRARALQAEDRLGEANNSIAGKSSLLLDFRLRPENSFSSSPPFPSALNEELETLSSAARLAADRLNAGGPDLVARLRSIPARAREVACQGLRIGAATVLAEGRVLEALKPEKLRAM